MTDRKVLTPDDSHPITVDPCSSAVVVRSGPVRIAETTGALTLSEAHYPPVRYIPRRDVDMSLLESSEHRTYCPYKGEARYYSLPALGDRGVNCVWSYEMPFEAVSEIAGYLAFYPDRVSIELVGTPT
ncbi:DUF427 domain-containing protein [Rhizobium halophytocola]|uniref:Uncharacterized protein (DUF427 family) n=1 Tax=Rhizobium halophytocola TaxID=735519 RepID=A0ABS4DUI5_9HYPH|nr:DUF427 domain-containing protein [Rhizobium halophytocola]MBP1849347.1 uncharacterized protein (DUF427 family) [Rhizobium halophytocola]